MPKLYSSFLLCFIFFIGCQSLTEIEKIENKNTVLKPSSAKEIYDPTRDQDVLDAFDALYDLSPTQEDIMRFEPSEFIYFDNPQKTPIRKAYSVLYKAAHKQRLALAPYCAKGVRDADCNTWWEFKFCDSGQPDCETKIIQKSAGFRTWCTIDNKSTFLNNYFPIGKNFFIREATRYAPQREPPSKAEQLENFFRIECS